MITALGKEVFSTIDEVVDPSHTALLMIDIQHDFCSPKGLFDRIGKSIDMMAPAVQRVANLVTAARRMGVLPIFIQNQWLPQNRAVSGSFLRFMILQAGNGPKRGLHGLRHVGRGNSPGNWNPARRHHRSEVASERVPFDQSGYGSSL